MNRTKNFVSHSRSMKCKEMALCLISMIKWVNRNNKDQLMGIRNTRSKLLQLVHNIHKFEMARSNNSNLHKGTVQKLRCTSRRSHSKSREAQLGFHNSHSRLLTLADIARRIELAHDRSSMGHMEMALHQLSRCLCCNHKSRDQLLALHNN